MNTMRLALYTAPENLGFQPEDECESRVSGAVFRSAEKKPRLCETRIRGALFGMLAASLSVSIAMSYITIGLLVLWLLTEKYFFKKGFEAVKTPFDIVFAAFLGVFLLSAVFGINVKNSFGEIRSEFLFAVFYLVYFSINSAEAKKIMKTFLIFSAAAALFGALQYAVGKSGYLSAFLAENSPSGLLKYFTLWSDRVKGTRSHPITYAECLFFGLVSSAGFLFAAEKGKQKIALIASVVVHGAAILLSFSRGVWIAAAAALILLFGLNFSAGKGAAAFTVRRKAAVYALILLSAMAAVFVFSPSFKQRLLSSDELSVKSNEVRLCLWESGLKIFLDYPLLGVGPGNIKKVYPEYRSEGIPDKRVWSELHCIYVHLAAERGAAGLGVFIWLMFASGAAIFNFVKKSDDGYEKALSRTALACLAGFLVFNLTENAYNDSEVRLIFYFLLGCVFAVFAKKDDGRRGL